MLCLSYYYTGISAPFYNSSIMYQLKKSQSKLTHYSLVRAPVYLCRTLASPWEFLLETSGNLRPRQISVFS